MHHFYTRSIFFFLSFKNNFKLISWVWNFRHCLLGSNRKTWARIPAQSEASFFPHKDFKFFNLNSKIILEIKNPFFKVKYVKYEKYARMPNCWLQYGLKILSNTFYDKMHIFIVSIFKNTIKIWNLHFWNKICEIRKKTLRWKIIFMNQVYKFSLGHFLIRCYFMFWF